MVPTAFRAFSALVHRQGRGLLPRSGGTSEIRFAAGSRGGSRSAAPESAAQPANLIGKDLCGNP